MQPIISNIHRTTGTIRGSYGNIHLIDTVLFYVSQLKLQRGKLGCIRSYRYIIQHYLPQRCCGKAVGFRQILLQMETKHLTTAIIPQQPILNLDVCCGINQDSLGCVYDRIIPSIPFQIQFYTHSFEYPKGMRLLLLFPRHDVLHGYSCQQIITLFFRKGQSNGNGYGYNYGCGFGYSCIDGKDNGNTYSNKVSNQPAVLAELG